MADPILWKRLATLNRDEIATRTKARPIDENTYELDILNDVYQIKMDACSILKINSNAGSGSDEHCSVAIIMYLLEGKNVTPAGEWVSPRDLPGGAQFFRGPHGVPVNGINNKYGKNKKDFETSCQRLGGQPIDFADTAYSFNVFPHLPISVLLWVADDEFPARVSILVDKTAYLQFPLDALLGALLILEEALLTNDSN